MNAMLPRLLERTPEFARRLALVQLFRATATAFRREMPRLAGLSRGQCLRAYARYTAYEAENALRRSTDLPEVRKRLYRNAYRLGRTAGWWLRVRDVDDVMAVSRFLYSILEIDFAGSSSGEITINRCYFCGAYSPQACELMSAMDSGLLAGLAGGGKLVFTERITEGRPACHAVFRIAKPASMPILG